MTEKQNRRQFLQSSAAALTIGLLPVADASAMAGCSSENDPQRDLGQTAPVVSSNTGKKPLRLGLIIPTAKDPDVTMRKLVDLGLYTAQLYVDDLDSNNAAV